MTKRILIIQGHPDANHRHFGDALVKAYETGAQGAGHETRVITVAELRFPLLASRDEWENGEPNADIKQAQESVTWADHLVLAYPLWLGTMPALLKGFLEQVLRPGFALGTGDGLPEKLLAGKSARIIVTMGMPAPVYRWFFRAHGLKNLERNILRFCGISPVRETLVGMVEGGSGHRQRALARLEKQGRSGT